ncbi:unnamed protein product [Haemonchus placei]|uniref:Uncharacterized protein n=1 Tax=Haemonchus placei TaxID=6290 RepID=A0A3P7YHM4_HAEPC|nr:unnamed protein product [Haemonchus placei]
MRLPSPRPTERCCPGKDPFSLELFVNLGNGGGFSLSGTFFSLLMECCWSDGVCFGPSLFCVRWVFADLIDDVNGFSVVFSTAVPFRCFDDESTSGDFVGIPSAEAVEKSGEPSF